jgi:hypothetical protein
VNATANSNPVAGAQVIVSTSTGNFSSTVGFTNSNGTCSFVFNAPSAKVQLSAVIEANVTKNGYIGNGNETTINVVPAQVTQNVSGFPLLTMLLIIIPVAVVVIVVVLIKLKVIVVSTEGQGKVA